MRSFYLLICVFVSEISYSQTPYILTVNADSNISKKGFYQVRLSDNNRFSGVFYISNGFTGYEIKIDSNATFQFNGFSCSGKDRLDSGFVKLLNNSDISLVSSKSTLSFCLFKLDDIYFLIEKDRKEMFLKEIDHKISNFHLEGPVRINNKLYSVNYCIATSLFGKYYIMEPYSDDGI